jgi:hypothetical protein
MSLLVSSVSDVSIYAKVDSSNAPNASARAPRPVARGRRIPALSSPIFACGARTTVQLGVRVGVLLEMAQVEYWCARMNSCSSSSREEKVNVLLEGVDRGVCRELSYLMSGVALIEPDRRSVSRRGRG